MLSFDTKIMTTLLKKKGYRKRLLIISVSSIFKLPLPAACDILLYLMAMYCCFAVVGRIQGTLLTNYVSSFPVFLPSSQTPLSSELTFFIILFIRAVHLRASSKVAMIIKQWQ